MTTSAEAIPDCCPRCGSDLASEWNTYYCPRCRELATVLGRRYLNVNLRDIKNERILGWARDKTSKGLYLHGPVGTGKTHILAALHIYGITTRLTTAPRLLFELRSSFTPGERTLGQRSEKRIIEDCATTAVLGIDDLGAEKTTDYALQSLYLIIDQHYRDETKIVVTSNLNLSELATKLDDRIASRIAEMCEVVKLGGKDRRIAKDEKQTTL